MTLTQDDLTQIRSIIREEVRDELEIQLGPIKERLTHIENRLEQIWKSLNEDVQLALKIAHQAKQEIVKLKKRVAYLEAQRAN